MHGFPWWFGLLLLPETWTVVAVLVAAGIGYAVHRARRKRTKIPGQGGQQP